jgi:hypothetical protein
MKLKLTKNNYKTLIDKWVNKENRDINYIFILCEITKEELILYAFSKNITIRFVDYATPGLCLIFFLESICE